VGQGVGVLMIVDLRWRFLVALGILPARSRLGAPASCWAGCFGAFWCMLLCCLGELVRVTCGRSTDSASAISREPQNPRLPSPLPYPSPTLGVPVWDHTHMAIWYMIEGVKASRTRHKHLPPCRRGGVRSAWGVIAGRPVSLRLSSALAAVHSLVAQWRSCNSACHPAFSAVCLLGCGVAFAAIVLHSLVASACIASFGCASLRCCIVAWISIATCPRRGCAPLRHDTASRCIVAVLHSARRNDTQRPGAKLSISQQFAVSLRKHLGRCIVAPCRPGCHVPAPWCRVCPSM
jgi:hypothetical protein